MFVAFSVVWKGILLGLGAAAPIGPVNVEIARRSLRQGFAAGFMLGCGAVTVDVTYAILASLSIKHILDLPWLTAMMGVVGGLVLAYLGVASLRSAVCAMNTELDAAPSTPQIRNYVTGVLMTSLNPMTVAFWFVVVPGIAGQLSHQPERDLPLICAGVFLGALSWVCFFTTLMSLAGRVAKRTTLLVADVVGGALLLCFAAYGIWQVSRRFL